MNGWMNIGYSSIQGAAWFLRQDKAICDNSDIKWPAPWIMIKKPITNLVN